MPSCRSAPRSPGTWTASPGCVPPPTAGLGGSSRLFGPISLRQYAGYEAGIRLRRRPRGRWDCHTPGPGTGFGHRFWAPSGRPTTMLSSVGLRSFVSWTLAPATATLSGPPAPSTRMLFLLPAFPRSVGLRPIAPPQNAPSPSSNRRTAIPNVHRPTPNTLRSGRPRHPPAPHALPNALPNAGRFGEWCCHLPNPWASGSIASGSIGRSYASGR